MRLKIALISLYVFENNGTRLIASVLRNAGYEVHEIYFKDYLHHHFEEPTDLEISRMMDVLREQGIGLVGMSIRAGAYLRVGRQFTRMIQQELGLPVIWGGAHISFDREVCIHDCDYLAVGEAEDTIVELCRRLEAGEDTTDIPGLWVNKGGTIHRNPIGELVDNLDRVPFRDYHSTDDKWVIDGKRFSKGDPCLNESVYLMLSSRGCAFDCKFCDVNIYRQIYKDKGQYFRVRSVDNVIAELKYAREHFKNLVRVRFDDELFPVKSAWVAEFAEAYKREIGLPFEILSDPRVIKDEDIARLKDAGLDHVLMGIQASEDVNRRLFGRYHTHERLVEVSRILTKHKVRAGYQIILDIPETTQKDSEDLLDLLLAMHRPFDLYSFSLNLWPGTELTNYYLSKGLVTENDVAGVCDKTLTQFRVDQTMDRPAFDRLFIALYHLTSKSFVPKSLIRWMGTQPYLREHPWPAIVLSETANFFKLGMLGLSMLRRGELSWNMFRRFFNLKAPVSI
ncbi:MAG: radical SAM protein [Deltaproteobacteria bacterium]|nr:radical SAM protein [Deltaproteobacteria bacterium]